MYVLAFNKEVFLGIVGWEGMKYGGELEEGAKMYDVEREGMTC